MRCWSFLRWIVALALVVGSGAAVAQSTDVPAEQPEGRPIAADVRAFVTAPIHARRPQWVRFGAALGVLALAYQRDERIRDHFVDPFEPIGVPDTHDGTDALPAAFVLGGTWAAATLIDSDDGRAEAGDMLEAAALSAGASYVLKKATRRERPYVGGDHGAFGSGGDSFPSMHTTVAFAIGATFAESGGDRFRTLRRVLGYGVAAGTAYRRMKHDAHWLSDTVAGGALGIATARFIAKRREADDSRGRFVVVPTPGGLEFNYAAVLK